ncbi:UNVERIFIED_CONTAM: hypothetical protein GTU68_002548 [Idotea baltica]|nr:hypothetical protein [Idotea baltica]
MYRERLRHFDGMTDISKSLREELDKRYRISRPELIRVQQSKDGTRKYLFKMSDGKAIESVLIAQPKRYTLCISSQVGCAIACSFCATGRMGLTRSLRTSEIIGQVLAVQDDIQFSNIVFMGMGEPLHNLVNVSRAVRLLNDRLGLDFSSRKITVSTSGLVPAINKFAVSGAEANLAISLNATTDEQRDVLIPINKRWPMKVLLQTLREYPLKKGRRITIEYVMLGGVNDSREDLMRLPRLLKGIPCKINLIPYNANAGLGYDAPKKEVVYAWQKSLLDSGMSSSIRWSKGMDIDAACGQLATESTRKRS